MIGEDVMAPGSETDQLRQQLLQAQRLSSVGAIASSVAHEFNNILTTIINYAKLAQRAPDGAAREQSLEKILNVGQRAATIISSMLGFARNQSNRREEVDLVKLVEEVLLLTEKDLSKHRVQVDRRYHARPIVPVVRPRMVTAYPYVVNYGAAPVVVIPQQPYWGYVPTFIGTPTYVGW